MDQLMIDDHQEDWSAMFAAEREKLKAALEDIQIEIEHIGSTAVPGLAAKPIIDIMVGVQELDNIDEAHTLALESIGYHFVDMPHKAYRKLFRKGQWRAGTHHLHIYELDSEYYKDQILFRNYLIQHPEEIAQYAQLKRTLESQFPNDRVSYKNAKSLFIQNLIRKAKA